MCLNVKQYRIKETRKRMQMHIWQGRQGTKKKLTRRRLRLRPITDVTINEASITSNLVCKSSENLYKGKETLVQRMKRYVIEWTPTS